jgi:hypothetical protein
LASPGEAAAADTEPNSAEQQQQEDEVGGATATAQAVDISNITDFVALGAGDNQLNNRAMRNLLLLHLRKVNVAELSELPEYEGPAALPDASVAAAHARGSASGGTGRASAAAAATLGPGLQGVSAPSAQHAMWGDIALQQPQANSQQQQAPGAEHNSSLAGRDATTTGAAVQQQQQQGKAQQALPVTSAAEEGPPPQKTSMRRVMFAADDHDQDGLQIDAPTSAALADVGASKDSKKRIRFADDA